MENLNNVPSTGTFGGSINQVNQNFGLVKDAIENVEGRTIRSKGLFPTQAALIAAYPSPKVGDYAYVGSSLPATIYDCEVEGTWHNTQQQGGSESVPLNNYPTKSEMNAAIAAIEIETVDNLNEETAASGKALDAHQGFVLAGQITDVQDEVDELVVETSLEDSTDRSLGTARNWYVNNSGKYAVGIGSSYYRCYTSVVTPGQKFAIQANSTTGAYYAFLASSPSSPTNGDDANFINVEGYQKKFFVPAGEKAMFTVPDVPTGTTVYLYIQRDNSNGNVFTPEYIHSVSGIKEVVSENNTDIVSLKNKIDGQTSVLSGTTIKQTIAQDNLVWNAATTGKTRAVIAPLADYVGKVLVITPDNANCNVALLASDAHTADTKPVFSRKERFIKIASDGEPYKVLITEEDLYLYYQSVGSSGASVAPIFTIEDVAYYEDVFSTIENFGLTLHRTDYNLVNYNAETNPDGIKTLELCIVSSTSLWSTTARVFFLDVSAHKGGYLFVSNNNANCYLAFLKDDSYANNTLPNYATGSKRTSVGTGMRIKFAIPNDANYVFFGYYNSSGTWQVPTGVIAIGKDIGGGGDGGSSVTDSSLDIGFKYLLKKARQLLNLKWTAKSNIAGTYATAGEHTGLLYSSVQEYDRAVGKDVLLKTFMTAVNNPYSLLYTENLHTGVSAYNFSYHAIGGDTTHAFFGTVCSRFACFVSGMEEWSTGHIAWLCKQGILTKIEEQSAQGVQIGDWVWIPGHVQVVTNVIKANGVVTNVNITEAWQPYVRLVSKTAENFDKYLHGTSSDNSKPGYVYRNNEIFKNVTYEPSPFVAIDDEVLSGEYQYNNDICTYAGDYACFRKKEGNNNERADYNVWLNYNLTDTPSQSWTAIKLYRERYDSNNVLQLDLVATYNDVDFTEHKYLIPSSDLTVVGKYRACLTDGTTESQPTYFEIIETNVSYTRNGQNVTVTFDSANGTPTKIVVGTLSGSHRAVRMLSPEERINGVVTFNPKKLSGQQTLNAYDGSNAYIKVFFKGEYGRVTNDPIKINYE